MRHIDTEHDSVCSCACLARAPLLAGFSALLACPSSLAPSVRCSPSGGDDRGRSASSAGRARGSPTRTGCCACSGLAPNLRRTSNDSTASACKSRRSCFPDRRVSKSKNGTSIGKNAGTLTGRGVRDRLATQKCGRPTPVTAVDAGHAGSSAAHAMLGALAQRAHQISPPQPHAADERGDRRSRRTRTVVHPELIARASSCRAPRAP